jgi:hypothetical protein
MAVPYVTIYGEDATFYHVPNRSISQLSFCYPRGNETRDFAPGVGDSHMVKALIDAGAISNSARDEQVL